MFIRWLGAYGKAGNLADSMDYEFRGLTREICAEAVGKHFQPAITHCKVGLVVKRSAVRRVAKGDVWSEVGQDGRLYPTRRPRGKTREAFCLPVYVAIIYQRQLSQENYQTVMTKAREYGLPVLRRLPDGQIKEIWKP